MSRPRYSFFLPGLSCIGLLVAVAFSALNMTAVRAAPANDLYELSSLDQVLAPLAYIVDVDAMAFEPAPAADGPDIVAQADAGPLMPEYAASYATNGLNFVETRLRC